MFLLYDESLRKKRKWKSSSTFALSLYFWGTFSFQSHTLAQVHPGMTEPTRQWDSSNAKFNSTADKRWPLASSMQCGWLKKILLEINFKLNFASWIIHRTYAVHLCDTESTSVNVICYLQVLTQNAFRTSEYDDLVPWMDVKWNCLDDLCMNTMQFIMNSCEYTKQFT